MALVMTCDMDLLTLIQCVPPLMDACVDGTRDGYVGSKADFRTFRLVSKEACMISQRALTEYYLFFTGEAANKNVDFARLLQESKLKHLTVFLQASGGFDVSQSMCQRRQISLGVKSSHIITMCLQVCTMAIVVKALHTVNAQFL